MSKTKSIEQVTTELAGLILELKASDFKHYDADEPTDHVEIAREHLETALTYLNFAKSLQPAGS